MLYEVITLGLDAGINHRLEGQLNTGLDHGNHQDTLVKILLLGDLSIGSIGLFESGSTGLFAPGQELDVVVGPSYNFV